MNGAFTRLGLPAYRHYESGWGTPCETFSEAESESSADIEARHDAVNAHPESNAAVDACFSHLVDGESHEYVLAEIVKRPTP